MELFHTSPEEITEINEFGRFGSWLFFAFGEYVMATCETITYTIEIDDEAVIDASELFYHDEAEKLNGLIEEVADQFGVDAETAEALIEQSSDISFVESSVEPEDLADASWDIQLYSAKAAEILGYKAISMEDEQGTAIMVNMLGRETELKKA